MFQNWFRCSGPLSLTQRTELELLSRQAIDMVGEQAARRADVLLDLSHLPPHTELGQRVEVIANDLKSRMNLNDAAIRFELCTETAADAIEFEVADGPALIQIDVDTARDAMRTYVTIARDLSHHIVSRVEQSTNDGVSSIAGNERLTDVLPIFFGIGPLQSHLSLQYHQWTEGTIAGHEIAQTGRLNPEELGYVMAIFASVRGESRPAWMGQLRGDSHTVMKSAMRMFTRRGTDGNPLFRTKEIDTYYPASIQSKLRHVKRHPELALATLWQLIKVQSCPNSIQSDLLDLAEGPCDHLAAAAINVLGFCSDGAEVEAALKCFHAHRSRRRMMAAFATSARQEWDVREDLGYLAAAIEDAGGDLSSLAAIAASLGAASSNAAADPFDGRACRDQPSGRSSRISNSRRDRSHQRQFARRDPRLRIRSRFAW